jgi:hypothetical protein
MNTEPLAPDPPTPAEIERARAALLDLWPSLLMLVRHGNGTLTVYLQGGAVVKWDAAAVTRHKPDTPY